MSGAKVAASAKDPFTLNALTGSNSLPSLNFTSAASHFTRGFVNFSKEMRTKETARLGECTTFNMDMI